MAAPVPPPLGPNRPPAPGRSSAPRAGAGPVAPPLGPNAKSGGSTKKKDKKKSSGLFGALGQVKDVVTGAGPALFRFGVQAAKELAPRNPLTVKALPKSERGWQAVEKQMPVLSQVVESPARTLRQIPDTAVAIRPGGPGFGQSNLGRQIRDEGYLNTGLAKLGDASLLAGGVGLIGRAATGGKLAQATKLERLAGATSEAAGLGKKANFAKLTKAAGEAEAAGDVARAADLAAAARQVLQAAELKTGVAGASKATRAAEKITDTAFRIGRGGDRAAALPFLPTQKAIGALGKGAGALARSERLAPVMAKATAALSRLESRRQVGDLYHETVRAPFEAEMFNWFERNGLEDVAKNLSRDEQAAVYMARMSRELADPAVRELLDAIDELPAEVRPDAIRQLFPDGDVTPEQVALARDFDEGLLPEEQAAKLQDAADRIAAAQAQRQASRYETGRGTSRQLSDAALEARRQRAAGESADMDVESAVERRTAATQRRLSGIRAEMDELNTAGDPAPVPLSRAQERQLARLAERTRRREATVKGETERGVRLMKAAAGEIERTAARADNRTGQVIGRAKGRLEEAGQLQTGVERRAKQAELKAQRLAKAAKAAEAKVKPAKPAAPKQEAAAKAAKPEPVKNETPAPKPISMNDARIALERDADLRRKAEGLARYRNRTILDTDSDAWNMAVRRAAKELLEQGQKTDAPKGLRPATPEALAEFEGQRVRLVTPHADNYHGKVVIRDGKVYVQRGEKTLVRIKEGDRFEPEATAPAAKAEAKLPEGYKVTKAGDQYFATGPDSPVAIGRRGYATEAEAIAAARKAAGEAEVAAKGPKNPDLKNVRGSNLERLEGNEYTGSRGRIIYRNGKYSVWWVAGDDGKWANASPEQAVAILKDAAEKTKFEGYADEAKRLEATAKPAPAPKLTAANRAAAKRAEADEAAAEAAKLKGVKAPSLAKVRSDVNLDAQRANIANQAEGGTTGKLLSKEVERQRAAVEKAQKQLTAAQAQERATLDRFERENQVRADRKQQKRFEALQEREVKALARLAKEADEARNSVEAAPPQDRPALRVNQRAKDFALELAEAHPEQAHRFTALADDIATTADQLRAKGIKTEYIFGGAELGDQAGPPATARLRQAKKLQSERQRTKGALARSVKAQGEKFARETLDILHNEFRGNLQRQMGSKAGDEVRIEKHVTGEEIARRLDEAGLVAWDPKTGKLLDAADVDRNSAVLPKTLHEAVTKWTATKEPGLALRIYDKATGGWKHTVLALSPRWHVGNIVGNAALATIGAGLSPAQVAKNVGEARRLVKAFEAGEDVPAEHVSALQRLLAAGYHNPDLAKVENARAIGRMINKSYHFNSYVDNVNRTMVYLAKHKGGVSSEAAVAMALKAAGDFSKMTPFERNVVRRIIPFYAWQRHITRLSLSLPVEHPTRVIWTLHLAELQDQIMPDPGADNEFNEGTVEIGGKRLNVRALFPFTSSFWADPTYRGAGYQVNPVLKTAIAATTGLNVSKGLKPVSGKFRGENPSGFGASPELMGIKNPGALAQVVAQQFPQVSLARDLKAGEVPVRYDTGEPRKVGKGATKKNAKPTLTGRGRKETIARFIGVPIPEPEQKPKK